MSPNSTRAFARASGPPSLDSELISHFVTSRRYDWILDRHDPEMETRYKIVTKSDSGLSSPTFLISKASNWSRDFVVSQVDFNLGFTISRDRSNIHLDCSWIVAG